MVEDVINPSGSDAVKALATGRASVIKELGELPDGEASSFGRFERALSRLMDTYFQTRMVETGADKERIALIAVGGYGRGELCLGSDIDIIILCRRKIPPKAIDLAQPLFLPLWDAGYMLGHGFRTIADCANLAIKDNKVLCSLLDARFLAGDVAIFDELLARMREKVIPRREKAFIEWLDEEHEERLMKHGDGAMLLEPNLKEGVGGLRDYHRLLWLARLREGAGDVVGIMRQAGFSQEDCDLLYDCVGFLHDARNRLHALSKRKNDQLFLDLQMEVASQLGYKDTPQLLAVEQFLGRLHRCMSDIKALGAAFRSAMEHASSDEHGSGQPIIVTDTIAEISPPSLVSENPSLVLDLFEQQAQVGAQCVASGKHVPVLSWETRQAIGKLVVASPELIQQLPGIARMLLSILTSGASFGVLEQMVGVGLLSVLLPDFGRVRDRVQFDGFHTFPVGRHTLYALKYIEELATNDVPVFSGLWRELSNDQASGVKNFKALFLAALFHDLGKGGDDASGHSEKGAVLAERQLAEWGVEQGVIDDVVFLVRYHLLLAQTAHRRDLSDESVVANCAGIVGDQRRLDMLYVLTYADSRATGPKAWSQWAGTLLSELYNKVSNMLRDNTLATMQSTCMIQEHSKAVRELVGASGSPVSPEQAEHYLDLFPSRYVLGTEPQDIVRHMGVVQRLEKEISDAQRRLTEEKAKRGAVILETRPLEGKHGDVWEVVVAARDQSGLLGTVAGVLALHGLNVFSADAYIWQDGTVLDVFCVSAPPDPLYAKEFWVKVRGAVRYALIGKLSLEFRIDQMRAKHTSPEHAKQNVDVMVDNTLSDFYTVIEIFAPDRPALLYDITRTLQAMQLDVLFAKIATLGSRTSDSFSVRDVYGGKILDNEQVNEVRNALLHVLK